MKDSKPHLIECNNQTEWLAERRKGIGASDAAVILGVSPFKSAYALYAEKAGEMDAEDLSEIERIKWGNRFQQPIIDGFSEDTGRSIEHWPPFRIASYSFLPWMLCTPDAIQVDSDRGSGPLEAKNSSTFMAHEWDSEPPMYYQVQLQHQMAVLSMGWGTLCVVLGGQELRWFDMQRNDRFIAAMTDAETLFQERVEKRLPPPIDGSQATAKALQLLHPEDSGETISLPDKATDWDARLAKLKRLEKKVEEQKTALGNRLKAEIGDNTYGLLPNGGTYSWRLQKRKAYSVKASQSRILRRLK